MRPFFPLPNDKGGLAVRDYKQLLFQVYILTGLAAGIGVGTVAESLRRSLGTSDGNRMASKKLLYCSFCR